MQWKISPLIKTLSVSCHSGCTSSKQNLVSGFWKAAETEHPKQFGSQKQQRRSRTYSSPKIMPSVLCYHLSAVPMQPL